MLLRTRLLFSVLVLVFIAGCDSTDESGLTTLNGSVVDARTDSPIEAATVNVVGTGQSATTDANGAFTLEVEADSTGDIIPLQVFARGYDELSDEAFAVIDGTVSLPDLRLTRSDDDGGGDGDGGGNGGGPDDGADEGSGPAASITLLSRSSESIAVRSAGADETATLTFVVLDAFGNAVDAENATTVNFSIANGPGGGEFLQPASDETNALGQVQTTLSSGTVAGTVQLNASATNDDGDEIFSLPVIITITGGLPDQEHFSVGSPKNVPGYGVLGVPTTVLAVVGDIYANPVQPGTAVYFTTTTGIIEGAGTTDNLGMTRVTHISAAPFSSGEPPLACPDSDPNGYSLITATTSDMNQQTITAQTGIVLSGQTVIEFTDVDADPDNGDLGNYGFSVTDQFGHPLASGTQISVIADGVNVEAVGDDQVDLDDHLCPGPGTTDFLISVVEGDEVGEDDLPSPPQLETLTIRVSSPNGNAQLTRYSGEGRPEIVFELLD